MLNETGNETQVGFFCPLLQHSNLILSQPDHALFSKRRGGGGRGAGGSEKNNENEKKIGVGGKS